MNASSSKASRNATFASAIALTAAALVAGVAAPACGTSSNGSQPGGNGSGDGGDGATSFPPPTGDSSVISLPSNDDGGTTPTCTGLQCQIHSCAGDASTTISGVVYDPAGNNPLYNVVVYVPNTTPSALPSGPSCESCASLYTGDPIAAAVTGADGTFTIPKAPDGATIPLVIQIGKWRKQTTLTNVVTCKDNPVTTKLTLPSKQSEGDIPNIAISTGGADTLECLLRRIGIDGSEYGPGAGGSGRIHIFQGSAYTAGGSLGAATIADGGAPASSKALWNSLPNLMPYDITILSCEGIETLDDLADGGTSGLTSADQTNLFQYTAAGGRVFASHFHYSWFNTGPFAPANIATWTRGANPLNDSTNNPIVSPTTQGDFINANVVTTFADGGPFPKGQIMNEWLGNVQALNAAGGTAPGELHITGAKHNADLAGLASTPSQGWLSTDSNTQVELTDTVPGTDAGNRVPIVGASQYLSFNTPIDAGLDDAGEPGYCGRVVYSDLHVGQASGDYLGAAKGQLFVPGGCANNPLSPQEKALEFMLFDLSSCVTPDTGSGAQPPPIESK